MNDDRLALRVGAGLLVAIVVAAVLVIAGDVRLRPRARVQIHMAHVGGLEEGAPVQSAGTVIGEIESIELATRHGGVILHAGIDRRWTRRAPLNGEWFVSSKGVLGERYLEIGPPAADAPVSRSIRDGDVIQGVDPPQLDRLAAISMNNVMTIRTLAAELSPEWNELTTALAETERLLAEIEPNAGAYARTWNSSTALYDEAQAVAAMFSDTDILGTADRARALLDHTRQRIATLRTNLDTLVSDVDRLSDQLTAARLDQFRTAAANARRTLARTERILDTAAELADLVATGRGTIGGFLHDHELRDFGKALGKILKRRGWEVLGHPRGSRSTPSPL